MNRRRHQKSQIRPLGEQFRGQPQTQTSESHLHPRPIRCTQAVDQFRRQGSGLTAHQSQRLLRQPPVHGQIERATQQKQSTGIGGAAPLNVSVKGRTEGPIDVVPAEVAHPHKRCTQPGCQLRGCRWNIGEHQCRLTQGTDPGKLPADQIGQILFQSFQSFQGGERVRCQGIGLHHPHIPSTSTLLNGVIVEQGRQETGLDRGAHHKPPVRTQPPQLLQHCRIPGRVAKAMAAAAGVDQHVRDSSSGSSS